MKFDAGLLELDNILILKWKIMKLRSARTKFSLTKTQLSFAETALIRN